jgi:predicted DNA-binding transcriptional regulator AlpA
MGEDMAALYVGVSLTTFRERVKEHRYPKPVREGKRLFWSRRQLDLYVDAQFGLEQRPSNTSGDASWDDLQ